MAAIGQEDIAGLDVAMDDAVAVGRLEGVGHLNRDVDELRYLDAAVVDVVAQRGAAHQLHHDERAAFVLADIEDRADVGMVQGGCGARLGAQPLQRLLVVHEVLRHDLDGHLTAQPAIFSSIDDAHPAGAQLRDNSVV